MVVSRFLSLKMKKIKKIKKMKKIVRNLQFKRLIHQLQPAMFLTIEMLAILVVTALVLAIFLLKLRIRLHESTKASLLTPISIKNRQ